MCFFHGQFACALPIWVYYGRDHLLTGKEEPLNKFFNFTFCYLWIKWKSIVLQLWGRGLIYVLKFWFLVLNCLISSTVCEYCCNLIWKLERDCPLESQSSTSHCHLSESWKVLQTWLLFIWLLRLGAHRKHVSFKFVYSFGIVKMRCWWIKKFDFLNCYKMILQC